jgi:hypothetical protein
MTLTSRIELTINLTIDQRLDIIKKIDQHFDILDFGIGPVPDDVDEKNITGSVENGVIEIILPKSKKKSVERLISLN